jgi:uncharacterized protein
MTYSAGRDILQQSFLSDATPRDSMCICELDGFLTGIAAGPKYIPVNEWHAVIWGSGKPNYQNGGHQKLILSLLDRRYSDIADLLDGSSNAAAWIDAEDRDDPIVMASAWANGFLQAMELHMDAWRPLLENPTSGLYLLPLVTLSRQSAEDDDTLLIQPLNKAMVAMAAATLPACARRINQFWRSRGATHSKRLLKAVNVIWPESSVANLVTKPLLTDVSNVAASWLIASSTDIIQAESVPNLVQPRETQVAAFESFCDKLRSLLGEENLSLAEATLPKNRVPVTPTQDVTEGDGDRELSEAVMITDSSGLILSVNDVFTSITGYSCAQVVGQTPRILKSPLVSHTEHVSFWQELSNTGHWHGEVWNRNRTGEPFLIRQTVTLQKNMNNEPVGYMSVFNKIDRSHIVAYDGRELTTLR